MDGVRVGRGWKRWEDIRPCLRGKKDTQRFEDIFNEIYSEKQTICRTKRLHGADIRGQKNFF
ncbi:hypothetical protein Hanom_Chr13g01206651 [Helianthus anomalus]